MNPKYRIEADTHCHTVASTHAYGTIAENAAAAARLGLQAVAITDHGPKLPDAPHPWHFYNMRVLPGMVDGVHILRGVEANIMDTAGTLDMTRDDLAPLDWVIASFHKQSFPVATLEIHTEAMIQAARHPDVDVIGHPDAPEYPVDIPAVVRACRDSGTFIEMNNSSFLIRKGGEPVCRRIAQECMRQGVQVVVGSDAHCPWDVGSFGRITHMLEDIGFPPELIFNRKAEHLLMHIQAKRGRDIRQRASYGSAVREEDIGR